MASEPSAAGYSTSPGVVPPGRSAISPALRNGFLDQWRGRERELEMTAAAEAQFQDAVDTGDLNALPVWASEAIDLINDVVPAAELVGLLTRQAEAALRRAGDAIIPNA